MMGRRERQTSISACRIFSSSIWSCWLSRTKSAILGSIIHQFNILPVSSSKEFIGQVNLKKENQAQSKAKAHTFQHIFKSSIVYVVVTLFLRKPGLWDGMIDTRQQNLPFYKLVCHSPTAYPFARSPTCPAHSAFGRSGGCCPSAVPPTVRFCAWNRPTAIPIR